MSRRESRTATGRTNRAALDSAGVRGGAESARSTSKQILNGSVPVVPGTAPGLEPGMTPFSLRPSTRQSANRGNGAHTSLSSRTGLERAPSQAGSRSGRPPRTCSQSALGTATVPRSGSRLGSAAPRPVLSKEMQELQRRLHRSDGFRALQDSLLLQEGAAGSGGGEPAPRLEDPAVLAEAIEKATALRPSPALLEEVQLLGTRGGGAWDFSTLADTLWDDEIAQRPPTRALDKGGRPRKHLFLPNVSCGFYNDNVAPASTLFGIKKVLSCCPPRASCRRAALAWPSPADAPRVQGSSSVRYNLFNNEYQRSLYATVKCAPRPRRPRVLDACCLLRLRPLVWPASAPLTCAAAPRGRPELLDAVNRDMKIVPASHPTTSRPLDPVPAPPPLLFSLPLTLLYSLCPSPSYSSPYRSPYPIVSF